MKVVFKDLEISTRKRFEVIDITFQVESVVANSQIENGLCIVHAPHATAAIALNEAERGLLKDIVEALGRLFPQDYGWSHNIIDDNAHAHLGSLFVSPTVVIPVRGGRLVRGTWQNILFIEMDGPRSVRHVVVEVMGV